MATYGYQPWVAHNHAVITNSMNRLVEGVKEDVILALRGVADAMLDYINKEADMSIPIYTGNLHDATGVAVYVDGAANYLRIPAKKAKKRQATGPSMGSRRYIDGHLFLQQSIIEGQTVYNKGIWFVLYSAVPYAAHIDTVGSPLGRGKDYFWKAKDKLLELILKSLKPSTKAGIFIVK